MREYQATGERKRKIHEKKKHHLEQRTIEQNISETQLWIVRHRYRRTTWVQFTDKKKTELTKILFDSFDVIFFILNHCTHGTKKKLNEKFK